MSGKAIVFYKKALKDLSKTLAEAVSELWKEMTEEIKKLKDQTNTVERQHSQGSSQPLPADQPTLESFWQTPQTGDHNTSGNI